MWPRTFDERLTSWIALRHQAQELPVSACLQRVNAWWSQSPWSPYYLHWDDADTWPDPWQMLQENIYCSLARGLGMLYTVVMLGRPELEAIELVETKNYNLVLIQNKKYALNWDPEQIVNITLLDAPVTRRLVSQQIQHQIH